MDIVPGQSCSVVNGRIHTKHDGKRRPFTGIVHTRRIRCFTLDYDRPKRWTFTIVVYDDCNNTMTVNDGRILSYSNANDDRKR